MSQSRRGQDLEIASPGRVTPLFARLIHRFLLPVVRVLWRPTLTGTENLPTSGPYLLVANHSAGVGFAEIHCFIALYLDQVGPAHPLAGFALPVGFRIWPLSAVHRQIGTIPSTYEAAAVSGSPKPPQSGETRRHRHFAASAARRLTGSLPSNRSQSAGCGLCG